jgi:hypothetical protein
VSNTLSKEQIDRIVSAHEGGIRRALEDTRWAACFEAPRDLPGPRPYPQGGHEHRRAFVTPDAYRSWIERFPSRGPAGPGEYRCARRVTPLKARSLRRHKTELEDQIVTGDGT